MERQSIFIYAVLYRMTYIHVDASSVQTN